MDNRKIGDYIHLHYDNYLKYGINKKGEKNSIDFNKYKKVLVNNTYKKLKINNLGNSTSELSNAVSAILSNNKGSNEQYDQEVIKKIRTFLETQFSNLDINWDIGDVNYKNTQNEISVIKKFTSEQMKQDSVELKSFIDKIQSLEKIVNSIPNSKDRKDLENRIREIYRQLNQRLTGKRLKDIDKLKNNEIKNRLIKLQKNSNEENDTLLKLINDTIKMYASVPAGLNLERGTFFEYVSAMAPLIAKKQVQKDLEQELKKLSTNVRGGVRSNIEISGDFFNENIVNLNNLKLENYSFEGNTLVSFLPSQEKIDVQLEWGENINLPISVKNINFNNKIKDINLVSESSMLYMIQDDNPSFVNHYLNIITNHIDNKDNKKALANSINSAHEAMKVSLFIKAISGGTYGRNAAKIFMVNSRTDNNKVMVYEISDIIKKALDYLDKVTVKSNDKNLNEIIINNKFSNSGAMNRIEDILFQIHAQKISVSINKNFIQNTMQDNVTT